MIGVGRQRVRPRRARRDRRAARRAAACRTRSSALTSTSATSGRDSRKASRELALARQPAGQLRPALAALERVDERRRAGDEALHQLRVRLEPHQVEQALELRGDARRCSRCASRMPSSVATRLASSARSNAANSAKLRALVRSMWVSLRACASRPASCACGRRSSRSTLDCDQRQHRRLPLRRQIELRQRRGHDLGRGGLEVEQQAQRLGEVDVGEVREHVAVDLAVEQAGQNRLAQQRLAPVGFEIEHRARELAEHHARRRAGRARRRAWRRR